MSDLLVGFGLILAFEGLLFAAAPNWMRRAMASASAAPDQILRTIGLVSAVIGVGLVWLMRG